MIPAVSRWLPILAVIVSGCGPSAPAISTRSVAADDALPVAFDFAERHTRGAVRREQSAVRFTDADREALIEGWASPEIATDTGRTFAWATARTATVRLWLLDTSYAALHLRCAAFIRPDAPAQTAQVSINGIDVGSLTIAATPTSYTLTVPPGTLAEGDNFVGFEFAYADAPSAIGRGDDTRPLAAAFDLVTLGWDTVALDDIDAERAAVVRSADGGSLVQQAESELVFTLTIPDGGTLEYGLRAATSGNVVQGEVAVRHADGSEEAVLSQRAEPGSDTRWRTDLSDYAGAELGIVFRAIAPGSSPAAVTWTRPRLHGALGGLDTTTNVVLIVVDTLRADYVSAYGGPVETPAMDRLAARGVRFANAYSHVPITVPSHSSMFTSLIPVEHGVLNNDNILAREHVTLAELLGGAYRDTAAFISLGVLRRWQGVAQGFDTFDASFDREWWKPADAMDAPTRGWVNGHDGSPFFLWAHYSDPHEPYTPPTRTYPTLELRQHDRRVASLPLDWTAVPVDLELPPGRSEIELEADLPGESHAVMLTPAEALDGDVTLACGDGCRATSGGDRFTLQPSASLIVTNPRSAPLALEAVLRARETSMALPVLRRRYGEEVTYVDRYVGALLDALEARGWLDQTLVILTSDHGEGLGDHERVDHVSELYDSTLRVPLIMSLPGTLPAGLIIDEPVGHIDLLPTIVELLHLPDPRAADREGTSLAGLITGRDTTLHRDRPLLSQTFAPEAAADLDAIVLDGYKLIRARADGALQLYDLSADPGEQDDLAAQEPARAAELSAALDEALEQAVPRAEPRRQGVPQQDLERLRSLGYVR